MFIVYDITNKDSFHKISSWISEINDAMGPRDKYIIVVIGQKVDIVENEIIKEEEAENMCIKNDLIWGGELSAKTFSSEQLKDLLKIYVKKIYEKVGGKITTQNVKNLNVYKTKKNEKKSDLIYNDPYKKYEKKCCVK